MKLIIAGGRDFTDYQTLKDCVNVMGDTRILEIVCGEARGADLLGRKFAEETGIPIHSFPADWTTHGKAAGHIRNHQMGNFADALLAFWDGKSKGTEGMIKFAKKKGLRVEVIDYVVN